MKDAQILVIELRGIIFKKSYHFKMNKIYIVLFLILTFIGINIKAETVIMETSKGSITINLDRKKAPITVENFLKYVDDGFYDDLIFHRVIRGFMIQGGGFNRSMMQKPTNDPIKNESKNGLRNEMYTIAMARTNDPDSATSQFFINLEDNYFLDKNAGYCVFGKVIEGQEIVKEIGNLSTHVSNGMGDVPIKTVTIKSIKLLKKGND
jgi:cyclophilin family peptidyl-prolyl cis-trans isomerase